MTLPGGGLLPHSDNGAGRFGADGVDTAPDAEAAGLQRIVSEGKADSSFLAADLLRVGLCMHCRRCLTLRDRVGPRVLEACMTFWAAAGSERLSGDKG